MPKDKPTAKMGPRPWPVTSEKQRKQVRAKFAESGITIRGWAKAQGFDYQTVIDVMHGRRAGHRGESHRVAVALGLKAGYVGDVGTFDPRKAPVPAEAEA